MGNRPLFPPTSSDPVYIESMNRKENAQMIQTSSTLTITSTPYEMDENYTQDFKDTYGIISISEGTPDAGGYMTYELTFDSNTDRETFISEIYDIEMD